MKQYGHVIGPSEALYRWYPAYQSELLIFLHLPGFNIPLLITNTWTLCMLGIIWIYFMIFLSFADLFFKINLYQKIFPGTLSECQTVWIQIRTDVWSVLIWVQSVWKGYLSADDKRHRLQHRCIVQLQIMRLQIMRGSRKFYWRGSNSDNDFFVLFLVGEGREDPKYHLKAGHYRPTSETPFKWHFAGVPMMAQH